MKKTLNVFGIIFAWFLSIALVVMLIVTPIVFSALSLVTPKTITDVITNSLSSGLSEMLGLPSAESVQITTLSETAADTNDATSALEGIFGDKVTAEQMETIMASQAAKEFIEAYTGDLTGVLTGSQQTSQFNAEKIKEIVNNNMDEVIKILKTVAPELADKDAEELKSKILEAVDQNADKLVEALPKAEELREQIVAENPALKTALDILAKKKAIKLGFIGVIVLISALIFVCRIPGLRGFRWLATNLFIGTGFTATIAFVPGAMGSVLGNLVQFAPAMSVIESLMSAFSKAMFLRAGVMLISGGLCLTAYILLRNCRKKKMLAAVEVAEETVEEVVEDRETVENA